MAGHSLPMHKFKVKFVKQYLTGRFPAYIHKTVQLQITYYVHSLCLFFLLMDASHDLASI